MNKLKSFDEFKEFNSGDSASFSKKVSILVDKLTDVNRYNESLFSTHIDTTELNEDSSPVLIWRKFKDPKIVSLNEENGRSIYAYNRKPLKIRGRFFSKFIGEDFIPKTIKDRNGVKKLNFPIVAMHPMSEHKEPSVFNTYNQFKNSESHYTVFQEKVIPKTRYRVVFFKDEPINIKESVNDEYFPFSGSNPAMFEQLKAISSKISKVYPLDVYALNVYESTDGKMYVKSMKSNFDLDTQELNELYIRLYEDYYETKLPIWFKNKVRENL